jgi:signal transduction histidine kinase
MDTAAPPLLEAALAAATFGALGIGLFCAAKEQLDHFSATHQTAPVDHRLLAATCTCLGLILFTGVLLFGFVVRDADDFQRLVEVDRFQQALQTVEADLHSAVAEGRRFIASNDLDAEAFVASVRTVDHGLNELPLLTSDPQQTVLVSVVLNRANSIIQPLRRAVALRRSGRTSEASEAVVAIHLDNRLESFAASVSQLAISLNAGMADRGHARIHRHRSVAIFAPVAGIVIIALLGTIHLYFEWQSSARHRSESAMRRHNETLRGFAHTVAHDLRAPLRGIAGYATELDGHAHLVGARGRHCINQIQHAAQNLERLIGDTLDYAQLDAETPKLTPVDLPTLVASLRQQRAEEIRKHGTQVDTQFGISEVMCWERGLAQIVGNLLDNAIKYSRNAQPPRIRIETAQTPLSWRLVMYDNGIGFDMKYHDRIFGLFQRLVTTEEFEGTGAGLAIVRKITDRLGGRVYAEGRPGGGATFLVELPRITNNDLA